MSTLVVTAKVAVRLPEANAQTNRQEMAVPTPEQLSKVSLSRKLDLFKTSSRILRILKAIERKSARQRLMPWFQAVMMLWMNGRSKSQMPRNTEAYQSLQGNRRPGVSGEAME